ncbi:hypothetical protein TanjilG_10416 [Lupinus angustifolius]|uniref:Serine-threonine/tyrosine-protein kinase catalytic domain-containing protein n=1 Tax=Lupinus angustifolius TaxID=3871 RepID=A0A4P1R516_LUPAN|nr:hypothetical protein TanjilG_10416 [Lupinus angustifolius]
MSFLFYISAWKVSRDGIEAATDLVPNSVPRPIARISVTFVAFSVALFLLKSFISTAFFVLATMGLAYFAFLAFNKDQGPSKNGGTTSTPVDDPVEEAKRIMEKYKTKNVLVDDFFVAKLIDFDLDKLVIWTDVYAFGILLLEILIGKKLGKSGRNGEVVDLPSIVKIVVLKEITMEVFDVELLKGIRNPMEDGLVPALKLAMGCCALVASVRPSMEEVVRQLQENRPRNMSALCSPTETRSGSITRF